MLISYGSYTCRHWNKVLFTTFYIFFLKGKGYPDINTRSLLKKIWDDCHLPIYALVDADPFGIEIMLSYRHGSKVSNEICRENVIQ